MSNRSDLLDVPREALDEASVDEHENTAGAHRPVPGAFDKPSPVWTDGLTCPSWCFVPHEDTEPLPDRAHLALGSEVPLMLAEPNTWRVDGRTLAEQPVLQIGLTQHVREVEPRVEVGPDRIRADLPQLNLTLDEAAALGRALLAEVDRAGAAGGAAHV